MTEYNIQGYKVVISTELENYRLVERMFAPFYASARQEFENWYRDQYDVKTVYKNISSIKSTILFPIVDSCISFLTRQKVYAIDAVGFRKRYIADCFDELDNILSDMMAVVAEIDGDLQNAAAYRKLRKECRDRVVVWGATREAYTRTKLEAGLKNAASGALHSIRNGIGNIVDGIKADSLKRDLYKQHREILANSVELAVDYVKFGLIRATEEETAISFELISKDDADRARAMINNFNRVPRDQHLQYLV